MGRPARQSSGETIACCGHLILPPRPGPVSPAHVCLVRIPIEPRRRPSALRRPTDSASHICKTSAPLKESDAPSRARKPQLPALHDRRRLAPAAAVWRASHPIARRRYVAAPPLRRSSIRVLLQSPLVTKKAVLHSPSVPRSLSSPCSSGGCGGRRPSQPG